MEFLTRPPSQPPEPTDDELLDAVTALYLGIEHRNKHAIAVALETLLYLIEQKGLISTNTIQIH